MVDLKKLDISLTALSFYMVGVFATFEKTHWYIWFAPLIPLSGWVGLMWLSRLTFERQTKIKEFNEVK